MPQKKINLIDDLIKEVAALTDKDLNLFLSTLEAGMIEATAEIRKRIGDGSESKPLLKLVPGESED